MSSPRKRLQSKVSAVDPSIVIENGEKKQDKIAANLKPQAVINNYEVKLEPHTDNIAKASNEVPCMSCGINHRQIKMSSGKDGMLYDTCHQCLNVIEPEFTKICRSMAVVEQYHKLWKAEPACMSCICGINMVNLYCKLVGTRIDSYSHYSPPEDSPFVCQSLIPAGMPYRILGTKAFGKAYQTPFYSIIPSLIAKAPDTLFSLHKLTLNRVLNNSLFRHELTFNHGLRIEPTHSILESSAFNGFWGSLEHEISDLYYSVVARPPVPALFQVINGIKALMLSVLPATNSSAITANLNPAKFIEVDPSLRSQFLYEITHFISNIVSQCATTPVRREMIKPIKNCFNDAIGGDPIQLASGLRATMILLNLIKIDQINDRIQDRVPLLWQTAYRFEATYYQCQVTSGKIEEAAFSNWIKVQPSIQMMMRPRSRDSFEHAATGLATAPSASTAGNSEPWFLSRLVAGFVWGYLAHSSRQPISIIFQRDHSRITSLQKKFDKFSLSYLKSNLERSKIPITMDVLTLLQSEKVRSSSVYKVTESRLLIHIASIVYSHLMHIPGNQEELLNRNGNQPSPTEQQPYMLLDSIISEIRLLLSLHWSGARSYYEEN